MGKTSIIYQKRTSLILYILGSIAIMAVSMVYINNAETFSEICNSQAFKGGCFENPIMYSGIGHMLLWYFSLCILFFLGMMIKPSCLFYINEEGFWCKHYGFIKWDNVTDLSIKNVGFETVIFFDLRDIKQTKMPILTKLSRLYKPNNFYIKLSGSFNDVNEVYKTMKSYV